MQLFLLGIKVQYSHTKFWLVVLIGLLSYANTAVATERIISLAPHTTELLFALGAGDNVVAVSDYSDFPLEASELPSVASHNGVDFEQIIRLQPTLIVAWPGGNKPQDLARLASLGFTLYYSSPESPQDIDEDILLLGKVLGKSERANTLAKDYVIALESINRQYRSKSKIKVFYYMWPTPLMTIGKNAWASKLLSICGAENIFDDAPTPYPEVSIEQVIRRRPQKVIAAMNSSTEDIQTYWRAKKPIFDVDIRIVSPDLLHRFTPRLTDGLKQLCAQVHR